MPSSDQTSHARFYCSAVIQLHHQRPLLLFQTCNQAAAAAAPTFCYLHYCEVINKDTGNSISQMSPKSTNKYVLSWMCRINLPTLYWTLRIKSCFPMIRDFLLFSAQRVAVATQVDVIISSSGHVIPYKPVTVSVWYMHKQLHWLHCKPAKFPNLAAPFWLLTFRHGLFFFPGEIEHMAQLEVL